MDWSARSSDMNVIKQVRTRMKLRKNIGEYALNRVNDLTNVNEREWEAVPEEIAR